MKNITLIILLLSASLNSNAFDASSIEGFLQIDNEWYIENIRSLGGDCNACQRYKVDTYKVVDDGLVVVDSRAPKWGAWERF